MKSKLYQITQENFETIYKYYDSSYTKLKKVYDNLSKYKKFTQEYCHLIEHLFNEEKDDNDLNINLNEYSTIEIDYGLNDKKIKNKILSFDKKYKKEINISPIVNCIEKINNFFNNYILNMQLFIKDIDYPLKTLKSNITAINDEINLIKEDYFVQQNNYISKYIEYLSLNDNLKILYNSVEENLVNYYKDKNILINKYQELQDMRIKLDLTIKEKIEKEEEILQKFNLLGNFGILKYV